MQIYYIRRDENILIFTIFFSNWTTWVFAIRNVEYFKIFECFLRLWIQKLMRLSSEYLSEYRQWTFDYNVKIFACSNHLQIIRELNDFKVQQGRSAIIWFVNEKKSIKCFCVKDLVCTRNHKYYILQCTISSYA